MFVWTGRTQHNRVGCSLVAVDPGSGVL